MRYDISKKTAPAMPNLGKGTECIKLLLSQASKEMHEPLVPMFFPILGAHISGAEFQYPDYSWKEPTGKMAHLVAHSDDNKAQLAILFAEALQFFVPDLSCIQCGLRTSFAISAKRQTPNKDSAS